MPKKLAAGKLAAKNATASNTPQKNSNNSDNLSLQNEPFIDHHDEEEIETTTIKSLLIMEVQSYP